VGLETSEFHTKERSDAPYDQRAGNGFNPKAAVCVSLSWLDRLLQDQSSSLKEIQELAL